MTQMNEFSSDKFYIMTPKNTSLRHAKMKVRNFRKVKNICFLFYDELLKTQLDVPRLLKL